MSRLVFSTLALVAAIAVAPTRADAQSTRSASRPRSTSSAASTPDASPTSAARPAPSAAPAPVAAPAPSAPSPRVAAATEREPRDHSYIVGLGMHGTRIRAEDGMRMGMAGPALVGSYYVGRTNGFILRGEMSFPVHGQMNQYDQSRSYNLRAMYEAFRLNFDVMFLYAHRFRPRPTLDVVVGAGIHVQTIRLISSKYNPIEGITGGLGGLVRVEHRFGRRFFYAGEMAIGVDPLDFVKHTNRIVLTTPMTASFMMGIRR